MAHQVTTYCLGCLLCRDCCPYGAIEIQHARPRIDQELCDDCGACVVVCPNDAIVPVSLSTASWG
jgi:ferredoxin